MVATTIQTCTRFRPPKIRLHCRLLDISLVLLCVFIDLHFVSVNKMEKRTWPYGRAMWVWLKLKVIPKRDFCVASIKAFFVCLYAQP